MAALPISLQKCNADLDYFRKFFAENHIHVAFAAPTATAISKNHFDAIGEVRDFLRTEKIHDFEKQIKGEDHKVAIQTNFYFKDKMVNPEIHLNRSPAKNKNHRRINILGLGKFADAHDLLALVVIDDVLTFINCSNCSDIEGVLDRMLTFESRVDKKLSEYKKKKHHETPDGSKEPKAVSSPAKGYVRDPKVAAWVLNEANGVCECCKDDAPFCKKNGDPFLEVHHVKWLATKGSDTTTNAVAVCPNCHRALHYSLDTTSRVEKLYATISRLVPE